MRSIWSVPLLLDGRTLADIAANERERDARGWQLRRSLGVLAGRLGYRS